MQLAEFLGNARKKNSLLKKNPFFLLLWCGNCSRSLNETETSCDFTFKRSLKGMKSKFNFFSIATLRWQKSERKITSPKHEKLTERYWNSLYVLDVDTCGRRGHTTQICIIERKTLWFPFVAKLKTIRF